MAETIDLVSLLLGRAILLAGAFGMAIFILAGAYGLVALAFKFWSARVFRGVVNFELVRQWNASGRPEWKQKDGRFIMVPTVAAYESPWDAPSPPLTDPLKE